MIPENCFSFLPNAQPTEVCFQVCLLVKRDSELICEVIVYSNSFSLYAAYR